MGGVLLVAMAAWGFDIPSNGQELGAVGLVLAAAIAVGLVVARLTRATRQHRAIGLLAAFSFVAALAYLGVSPAGLILWVLAIGGGVWAVAAFLTS